MQCFSRFLAKTKDFLNEVLHSVQSMPSTVWWSDAIAIVQAPLSFSGIIDGTGSVGAAIGQYLVAVIQRSLGWRWVFFFFILMVIDHLVSYSAKANVTKWCFAQCIPREKLQNNIKGENVVNSKITMECNGLRDAKSAYLSVQKNV